MANFFFLMNSTGTKAWRVSPIKEALEKEGHKVEAVNLQGMTDAYYRTILKWADVLIFQMVSAKFLPKEAKKAGIYTIFDCDDLISSVPEKHPNYQLTRSASYQRDFRQIMKNVDLVTVSSELLLKQSLKHNPNTILLPNFLPEKFWKRPINKNKSKWLRLGWAGGISHVEDLEFIAPVIEKIMAKYPQVKFVYTGGGGWNTGDPNSFYKYGEDLFKNIPHDRREYNTGSRIDMWPDRLNSMQLDIALAPLSENRFSRAKTPIKYYEYAINRWAGIYQDFLYGPVVKDGETGLLARTQEDYYNKIEELINDTRKRLQLGANAYRDVKASYCFAGANRQQWLDVYRQAGTSSRKGDDSFFVGAGGDEEKPVRP